MGRSLSESLMTSTRARPRAATGPGRYDRALSAEARHRQQRARLVDAAIDAFAEHGLGGTTVERVVGRVRMSRRTFYEHFDDLADAHAHVLVLAEETVVRALEVAMVEAAPAGDVVRTGVVTYAGLVRKHATLVRLLLREDSPAAASRVEAHRARLAIVWTRALARTTPAKALDPLVIQALVAALDAGAMMAAHASTKTEWEAAVETLCRTAGAIVGTGGHRG